MKVVMNIKSNLGYKPNQVAGCPLTVGQLKEWLEDEDDETPILVKAINNEYGAQWGYLVSCGRDYTDEDEEEEGKFPWE